MKKFHHLYLALILSFILGIRGGNVALLRAGSGETVRIFPCQVLTLPAEARSALERGIPIDSVEQLEELAENYLS